MGTTIMGLFSFLLVFIAIVATWGKEVKIQSIYKLLLIVLVPYIIAIVIFLIGLMPGEDLMETAMFIVLLIAFFVSTPGLLVLGVRMMIMPVYREKIIGLVCLASGASILVLAYVIISDPGFI